MLSLTNTSCFSSHPSLSQLNNKDIPLEEHTVLIPSKLGPITTEEGIVNMRLSAAPKLTLHTTAGKVWGSAQHLNYHFTLLRVKYQQKCLRIIGFLEAEKTLKMGALNFKCNIKHLGKTKDEEDFSSFSCSRCSQTLLARLADQALNNSYFINSLSVLV